ncbi:FHA domain-containing protein [Microbispora cellulosiformans]|uniref:FHA domain-containing protein n=1 Tax=Microbispora cellulosiformans TaxID=2614688 RepID=A0A5J5K1E2_9ACTN|nr:FHA domain-containing protein [Microbispora cellulosiformans]KAA9377548.1 FHA domain-containing protein [Microbispora cellulosiformans]
MTEQGVGVVRPLPGEGVVAHLNGLLLVCATGGDQPVEGLLSAMHETATTGGDGRALARRVAQVLARAMDRSTGEPVACAVAGPAGGGVAVLVSGAAYATVSGPEGEVRLAGHDALTWTDRLVNGPVSTVLLRLPGAGPSSPYARLDGGVVTGAGLECDLTRHGDLAFPPLPPRPPQHQGQHPGTQPPPGGVPEPIGPRGPVVPPPPVSPPAQPPLSPPVSPPVSPFGGGPLSGPGPSGEHAPPQPSPQSSGLSSPPVPPPSQPPHVSQPLPPVPSGLSDPAPAHHSGPQPAPPYTPSHSGPQQPPGLPEPPDDRGGPQDGQDGPAQDRGAQERGQDRGGSPDGPGTGPLGGLFDGPFEGAPQASDEEPGEATQLDMAPDPEQRPMVYGVDCKNDHFNDPRAPYCAVCGVPIDQRAVVPYKGPRPPLGALLLDDGMALPLEADYLLGRDPERAPEVQSGEARPARVTSPDGSVSRRHLRVFLENWDVNLLDLGSVNGTQIQPPGDPNFYDIPPNEPVSILPGTTVRIGVSRTMRYEAHRPA